MSIKWNTLTISDGIHHKGMGLWALVENYISPIRYHYVLANISIPGYQSDKSCERIYLKPNCAESQEEFEKGILYRAK